MRIYTHSYCTKPRSQTERVDGWLKGGGGWERSESTYKEKQPEVPRNAQPLYGLQITGGLSALHLTVRVVFVPSIRVAASPSEPILNPTLFITPFQRIGSRKCGPRLDNYIDHLCAGNVMRDKPCRVGVAASRTMPSSSSSFSPAPPEIPSVKSFTVYVTAAWETAASRRQCASYLHASCGQAE